MIVTLDTYRLTCIADMQAFLDGSGAIQFRNPDRAGRRQWLTDLLRRFCYPTLTRADKGTLRRFAQKVGGFSRAQLARLIAQWRDTGQPLVSPPAKPEGLTSLS